MKKCFVIVQLKDGPGPESDMQWRMVCNSHEEAQREVEFFLEDAAYADDHFAIIPMELFPAKRERKAA